MYRKFFFNVVAISLVPLLGLAAAQQSDQDPGQQLRSLEREVAQLQERLAVVSEQATTTGLIAAIQHIDSAGFHGIDQSLQDGEIDPRYASTVDKAIVVAQATTWPEELEGQVAGFVEAATELVEALEAEDVAAGADAASQAHDKQHVLSHAVYATLAGEEADTGHGEQAQIPEGAVELSLELSETGGAVGGAATHRVERGDTVALTVRSQAEGVLHLHGYDLEWELTAGQGQVFTFDAPKVGRFPLELHPPGDEPGISVGYVEVRP